MGRNCGRIQVKLGRSSSLGHLSIESVTMNTFDFQTRGTRRKASLVAVRDRQMAGTPHNHGIGHTKYFFGDREQILTKLAANASKQWAANSLKGILQRNGRHGQCLNGLHNLNSLSNADGKVLSRKNTARRGEKKARLTESILNLEDLAESQI